MSSINNSDFVRSKRLVRGAFFQVLVVSLGLLLLFLFKGEEHRAITSLLVGTLPLLVCTLIRLFPMGKGERTLRLVQRTLFLLLLFLLGLLLFLFPPTPWQLLVLLLLTLFALWGIFHFGLRPAFLMLCSMLTTYLLFA